MNLLWFEIDAGQGWRSEGEVGGGERLGCPHSQPVRSEAEMEICF